MTEPFVEPFVMATRHPGRDVPMIHVRAVGRGFIYDVMRNAGDEFGCAIKDLAIGPGGWMEPANDTARAALEDIPAFVAAHARSHAEILVKEAALRVTQCQSALDTARRQHAERVAKLAELKEAH
jgi:hypothetical protein